MSDRELLELAAKAAGMRVVWVGWMESPHCRVSTDGFAWSDWNPLMDNADAFRLAVKLRIDVRFQQDGDMYVDAGKSDAHTVYLIDTTGDHDAATRRAIVRAAASA